jgi:hypothetical protein
MVTWTMNGVVLDWWLEVNSDRTIATLMVKKHDDARALAECEKYPVFSIRAVGDCYRHPGLPTGWGFKLTRDRKIKEVR